MRMQSVGAASMGWRPMWQCFRPVPLRVGKLERAGRFSLRSGIAHHTCLHPYLTDTRTPRPRWHTSCATSIIEMLTVQGFLASEGS